MILKIIKASETHECEKMINSFISDKKVIKTETHLIFTDPNLLYRVFIWYDE